MNNGLKSLIGILNDKVRIYRFVEASEVQQDEFKYCQLLHQIVFGDRGLAQTLGPTWNLVHDPRFWLIEEMMIQERRGIFGGDARLGVQYITDNGPLTSSVGDLEKYADILGEGRNFHNVLVHPNENCPVRKWLERIYKGYSIITPHLALKCACTGRATEPTSLKTAPDGDVWALIQQECPNRAFGRGGQPTIYGTLMFNLIRADLIGLIHDYADTPLIDSYVYLKDNGVVVNAEDVQKIDPNGLDHQRVLQEIDILEQALTHRATLRVTAAKILNNLHFDKHIDKLRDAAGEKVELTDIERDDLLRLVYTSNWPDDKPQMIANLLGFLSRCSHRPLAERQTGQLAQASAKSRATIEGLQKGVIRPINHYTEPVLEIPEDQRESEVMRYAAVLDSLTKNPLKAELFQVYVAAEQDGEIGVLDLLTPIFDPNYELNEETYFNLLRAITHRVRSLRAVEPESVVPRGTEDTATKKTVREVEGEL